MILSDTNGHSPAWHSKDIKPGNAQRRGEAFEREFFAKRNLTVLNREEQGPTFYSAAWGTSTNIDVTLCSTELRNYISNHTHRDYCPASDHVGIDMTVCLAEDEPPNYRFNFRGAKGRLEYMERSSF